jgi:hypothetical protein
LKAVQAQKCFLVEQVDMGSKRSWNEVALVPLKSTKVGMEAGHQIDWLHERALHEGEALCCDEFSMQRDGLASSSGWQGCALPQEMQSQLKCLYQTGETHDLLWPFHPAPRLQ